MNRPDHPHPCSFRLTRWMDRGWGELACEYRWDATEGSVEGLERCQLYELIRYADTSEEPGWFFAADPPFVGWRFRNPTDGRTAPVGLECFPASWGYAWDRHKMLGRLALPAESREYVIRGIQEFRFQCELCGADEVVPGTHSGPHAIERRFTPVGSGGWRYSTVKHGLSAWMDLDANGYVADSANIGFGPW